MPLKTKIFVWQMLRDRLPSGVEVTKRHGPGDGLCPLCAVPETGTHIMFSCPAARFLWSFVHEALGSEWQALDLGEFLEVNANRTGRRRGLFWLVFAAMTWTLWTILCLNSWLSCSNGTRCVGSGTRSGWTACWRTF